MKKIIICLMCLAVMCVALGSCNSKTENNNLWESAIYTDDAELGNGNTTIKVKLTVEDKSITFTVNTDKETLGEALVEHKLISGEKGAYGMYVKKVNGIEADYDKTKTYWGFGKNGESMLTGVDAEKISDGNNYEINYITENTSK